MAVKQSGALCVYYGNCGPEMMASVPVDGSEVQSNYNL